ncbi:MAG: hypothetical protein PHY92_10970 [Alphaproteobacteria bacterium]|nr:hypothetical protein [Alphaproteobacteria bacterium]
MTKERLLNDIFQWGVLAAIVAIAVPDLFSVTPAFAQELSTTVTKVQTGLTDIPHIVSSIAFIGGGVLGISGALKLKAHAENPAQEKMAPGIARLLAGGAIAALPVLIQAVINSADIVGSGATYSALDTVN